MSKLIILLLPCLSTAFISQKIRWGDTLSKSSPELSFPQNQLLQRVYRFHAEVEGVAFEEVTAEEVTAAIVITPSSPNELLLPKMSTDADVEKNTALARRVALEGLTSALTRTLDRSSKASGILAEEFEAVQKMINAEIATENTRETDLGRLRTKLEAVMNDKETFIETETSLLRELQSISDQITEVPIRKKVDDAVNTKAELISIEVMLMELMRECSVELNDVIIACVGRRDTYVKSREDMKAAIEESGTWSDEWENIAELQEFFLKMRAAVSDGETKIQTLRNKISAAMEQRNVLLGRVTAK